MPDFKIQGDITWESVVKTARDIVLSLKDADKPKYKKLTEAVDKLADAVDDALTFGEGPFAEALESVDGLLLRGLFRIIVQFAFRNLKNEGAMG